MRKEYSKPSIKTIYLKPCRLLQGSKVYTDDPQSVSSAMSRRSSFFNDYSEDDAE